MKEILKINEKGEVKKIMSCIKKIPTCIRLTQNGKIKLQELCNNYGFNQSTMIELIITLYHEKMKKEENK